MAVCQNLVPLVNIKIASKWMFIPLKMVLIGIDPYPYHFSTGLPIPLPPAPDLPRTGRNAEAIHPPRPGRGGSGGDGRTAVFFFGSQEAGVAFFLER